MLKIDRIPLRQVHLGHRHDLALYLASAIAEANLGHIADARCFPPPRLADHILDVQRRATSPTTSSIRLVLTVTPLTHDPLQGIHSRSLSDDGRWTIIMFYVLRFTFYVSRFAFRVSPHAVVRVFLRSQFTKYIMMSCSTALLATL